MLIILENGVQRKLGCNQYKDKIVKKGRIKKN